MCCLIVNPILNFLRQNVGVLEQVVVHLTNMQAYLASCVVVNKEIIKIRLNPRQVSGEDNILLMLDKLQYLVTVLGVVVQST